MQVSGLGIMMLGVASLFTGVGKVVFETEHELKKDDHQERLKKYGLNMNKLGMTLFKIALTMELGLAICRALDPITSNLIAVYLNMASEELAVLSEIFILAQTICMID
jgi:hypothetical protein